MRSNLRIGIDFDNTIITYDDVFLTAAKRCGLVDTKFSGSKQAVRDAIRLLPDGELAWQRLQGQVYGRGIGDAKMVAGVAAFLRRCRAEGCAVVIVSHKTEYGHFDPARVNLRTAALNWMVGQGSVRRRSWHRIARRSFREFARRKAQADCSADPDPLHRRSRGGADRCRFPA